MTLLLSIDGGGALGAGPLRLLAQLEADGINLHDDALAGTSVGGILALARASGRPWMEIEQVFNKWVGKIFATAPWWWRADPTRPKYQSDGLEAAVDAIFGTKKCADAEIPFFVTTFDMATGTPKVITNLDDLSMRDAALMTSAAPTYFQPRGSRWVDGALAANNPVMVGIAGSLRQLEIPVAQLSALSLGTTGFSWKDPQVGRRTAQLGWVTPILNALLDGDEDLHAGFADAVLPGRHLRVSPKIAHDYPMDDLTHLAEFKGLWQNTYTERKAEILRLVQTGKVS